MSTVYSEHHCCSFQQLVWHPFNCVRLTGPSSATERESDNQCLASLDDTIFAVKIFRVKKWPDWGPNYSVANFSCFRELQCTGNRRLVYMNCRFNHSFVSLHLCKELKTLILLQIKYWTLGYMDYSAVIKSNTLKNAWNGRNMWTVNNGWVVISVKYGFIR